MKAVILAGGLGSRLKPFTEVIPKPLLPIGEKSVLEIQINHLGKFGFNEIFLATNYKSDYIENFFGDGSRYGISLKISKEDKPLGTAGPLKLLQNQLDEPFLVMNGDILTLLDFNNFYSFSLNLDCLLSVAIKKEILPFAFGNIFFENDYITQIQEKPDIITYIVAGIYIMKPEILSWIPDDTYYGMDQLIKKLLSKEMKVAKFEINNYWLDIGRLNDYEKAQNIYEQYFKDS